MIFLVLLLLENTDLSITSLASAYAHARNGGCIGSFELATRKSFVKCSNSMDGIVGIIEPAPLCMLFDLTRPETQHRIYQASLTPPRHSAQVIHFLLSSTHTLVYVPSYLRIRSQ